MQGHELKEARLKLGMSQGQLDEALGFTPGYVGKMERGDKPIERRTELAIGFLRARPLMAKRVQGRVGDIAWSEYEHGYTAQIGEFKAWVTRQTHARWSIHLEHESGYSPSWPQWENSLDMAKGAAALAAQKGYADLAEGAAVSP
jgi:DNA-binding XRE family transcriptional regulator